MVLQAQSVTEIKSQFFFLTFLLIRKILLYLIDDNTIANSINAYEPIIIIIANHHMIQVYLLHYNYFTCGGIMDR